MESREHLKKAYSQYTSYKVLFVSICFVLTITLFFVSLAVGTRDLSVYETYHYFIKHLTGTVYQKGTLEWFDDNIVWNYRVPRAVFAIFAGAGISVAGAVMQSVMKNPLADPYTTGISSGALFGVAVAVCLGFSAGAGGIGGIGVLINAVMFAFVPTFLIIFMAPFFRRSVATLILTGVAVSYIFNSLTSLILVTAREEDLSTVCRWQIGSLTELGWDAAIFATIVSIIGIMVVWPLANKINVMSLDDKDAKALGLDTEKLRILCLIIVTAMVSVTISFSGIIGFVGLVVPHILRLLIGSDNRFIIPASACFGAFFILGCDILARYLDFGAMVPVGVITSLIGAPLFLILIVQSRRRM